MFNCFIKMTQTKEKINMKIYSIILSWTLKGICGVRIDNRKVFPSPGPMTKYFERVYVVQ